MLKIVAFVALLLAPPVAVPMPPGVPMPPWTGAAYGWLGKAMMTHDAAGVRTVWAENFVVNAPNNAVVRREEVIAAMERDFLDYKDFRKQLPSWARSRK